MTLNWMRLRLIEQEWIRIRSGISHSSCVMCVSSWVTCLFLYSFFINITCKMWHTNKCNSHRKAKCDMCVFLKGVMSGWHLGPWHLTHMGIRFFFILSATTGISPDTAERFYIIYSHNNRMHCFLQRTGCSFGLCCIFLTKIKLSVNKGQLKLYISYEKVNSWSGAHYLGLDSV